MYNIILFVRTESPHPPKKTAKLSVYTMFYDE